VQINALKNPTNEQIAALVEGSKHRAARRLVDEKTGDVYVWDACKGTHAECAAAFGLSYSLPPGAGEIIIC
jgi:hypothetical protein